MSPRQHPPPTLPIVGWREWVSLPGLGVVAVKAKIDTGARSSALHAFELERFTRRRAEWVRFKVHPIQRSANSTAVTEAEVLEWRHVKSSSGHAEERPVIVTDVAWDGELWPIELTLTNRDEMGFRMLLGREALRKRFLVDAGRSYYGGRPPKRVRTGRAGTISTHENR